MRKIISLFSLKILAGFIFIMPVNAQTDSPKSVVSVPVTTQNNSIITYSGEDYLVGSNDILDIKVEDAPELSKLYRLNSKGIFTFPTLGNIDAKNKTVEELTEIITKKLKEGYLINPIVSIMVNQSNKRSYFIQGSVHNPGTYQVEGRVSLLKLIIIAGGLTTEHSSTAFVMREKKIAEKAEKTETSASVLNGGSDANDYEIIKINIKQLLAGDLDKNIAVESGDIVNIPVSEMFFVTGEVNKPGSYTFSEGTTLQQAISLAGGLSAKAGSTAFLMREKNKEKLNQNISDDLGSTGSDKDDVELIEINVNELMRGKINKNIEIKPRDLIQISEAGVFFVGGEVKESGSFPIREKMTVQRAISLAKGTNYEADLKKGIIYRQNPLGERKEIQVNIAAVMKGEIEDVEIFSNDILIVPNNKSKSIKKSLLNILFKGSSGVLLGDTLACS